MSKVVKADLPSSFCDQELRVRYFKVILLAPFISFFISVSWREGGSTPDMKVQMLEKFQIDVR